MWLTSHVLAAALSTRHNSQTGFTANLLVLHTVVLEEEEWLEGIEQEVSQVLIQVCGQNATIVAV